MAERLADAGATSPTTVVLIRHAEREDYVAAKEGKGAEWISRAERPWDPPLARLGHEQALLAARRLRSELGERGLPEPTAIFASPMLRCVETGAVVAKEFAVEKLCVEEGLLEAVCEAWMRQWAIPGADTAWGGPPHAEMPEETRHLYSEDLCGPAVEGELRAEAKLGLGSLIRSASELAAAEEAASLKVEGMGIYLSVESAAGFASAPPPVPFATVGGDNDQPCLFIYWRLSPEEKSSVDPHHPSVVSMRDKGYCWGRFETRSAAKERVAETVRECVEQNQGRTLVFVSHGSPTSLCLEALARRPESKGPGDGGLECFNLPRQAQEA